MESRHPITAIVSEIERTHRRIKADLEVLDASDDLDRIRAVLNDLPGLLRGHFQDEEKPDGLFDEIASLSPAADSQLKSLRQEHREIMEALKALQEEARVVDEQHPPSDRAKRVDHIRSSATGFVQRVRRHELIESRLVADTYYSEDGGRG